MKIFLNKIVSFTIRWPACRLLSHLVPILNEVQVCLSRLQPGRYFRNLAKNMQYSTDKLGPCSFFVPLPGGRVGGGRVRVNESMDGRGCAILALDLVPNNSIFA